MRPKYNPVERLQGAARDLHRVFLTDQKPGESLEAYNEAYEEARNRLVHAAYEFCQGAECNHARPNGVRVEVQS